MMEEGLNWVYLNKRLALKFIKNGVWIEVLCTALDESKVRQPRQTHWLF